LREVLAAADHDFVLTEPASKPKHLWERLLTARRRGSRRTGPRGRRYLSILAAGFFVATAAAILLNALVWQRTRHPTPFFARAVPAAPANAPTAAEMSAVPPSRPQPAVIPVQTHDKPVEKPPLEMPAGEHPRQARVNSSPPHDVISQLLKAPPAPPARLSPEAAASTAPSKLVITAQRALIKLGFVLKPDGVAGLATRQAIERYERDHGLPVRGELSRAIMRQLSAETGSPIN
jgi:hypothetical protein